MLQFETKIQQYKMFQWQQSRYPSALMFTWSSAVSWCLPLLSASAWRWHHYICVFVLWSLNYIFMYFLYVVSYYIIMLYLWYIPILTIFLLIPTSHHILYYTTCHYLIICNCGFCKSRRHHITECIQGPPLFLT